MGKISFDTELGAVTIIESDGKISNINIEKSISNHSNDHSDILNEAKNQITEYLSGKRKKFTLPLLLDGTEFQKKIWTVLIETDYATVISYRDLAALSGFNRAYRACGSAVGKNKFPIIIPCHRVIKSDGSIGGFSMDIEIKKKLLQLEKENSY